MNFVKKETIKQDVEHIKQDDKTSEPLRETIKPFFEYISNYVHIGLMWGAGRFIRKSLTIECCTDPRFYIPTLIYILGALLIVMNTLSISQSIWNWKYRPNGKIKLVLFGIFIYVPLLLIIYHTSLYFIFAVSKM